MLNVDFQIHLIHYEETLEALFPHILKAVEEMSDEKPIVRLCKKLGAGYKGIVTGILCNLPQASRNELFCWLIDRYRDTVCKKLNDMISASEFENCISVNNLTLKRSDESVLLSLNDVNVDYGELLKNQQVQNMIGNAVESNSIVQSFKSDCLREDAKVGRFVSHAIDSLSQKKITGKALQLNFFRRNLDRQVIGTLEKNYLPEQLGGIVTKFLNSKGVYAEIGDVTITKEERTLESDAPNEFSKELENAIIDAIAQFLKEIQDRYSEQKADGK